VGDHRPRVHDLRHAFAARALPATGATSDATCWRCPRT
jgi:hypothetical protein